LIRSCGIENSHNGAWMRPCPNCGSENTEVCRWKLTQANLFERA
jgi:hypothetical protein